MLVLLAYQAFLLWQQRPRSFGEFSLNITKEHEKALEEEGCLRRFRTTHQQLLQAFGSPTSSRSSEGSPYSS